MANLERNGTMALRAGYRKITADQKAKWLNDLCRIKSEIEDHGLFRNDPLEEVYYNLDQIIERLREVRVARQ